MFAATAPSPRSVRATQLNRSAISRTRIDTTRVHAHPADRVYELPLYAAPRRTEPAVFVRRQVMVLLVAAVVLGALSFGLRSAVGALTSAPASGGEGVAASNAPGAGSEVAAGVARATAVNDVRVTTYVVQPGDTLWTIARALQPTGDPAAVVQALAKANGGSDLDTGDVLVIP